MGGIIKLGAGDVQSDKVAAGAEAVDQMVPDGHLYDAEVLGL